jgi:cation/acetate symporter
MFPRRTHKKYCRGGNHVGRRRIATSAPLPPGYLGAKAIWPLVNPTVVALPIGILGAVLGSLLTGRNHEHEKRFSEVTFRIQTGLGSDHP